MKRVFDITTSASDSSGQDAFQSHGASVAVLHPSAARVAGNDNANSVVLQVEYQGQGLLLTGDIESEGLDQLLQQSDRDVELAMAPHHGSIRSRPDVFCQWCSPDMVVVSGAKSKNVTAGVASYESQGCQVLHTGTVGCVSAVIRDRQLTVSTYR